MTGGRRPGEPLAALTVLLGAWVVGRVALWEPPLAMAFDHGLQATVSELSGEKSNRPPTRAIPRTQALAARAPDGTSGASVGWDAPSMRRVEPELASVVALARIVPSVALEARAEPIAPRPAANIAVRAAERRFPPGAGDPLAPYKPRSRFSGEGWILFRPGAATAGANRPLVGRYGASQTGATVRYRLSDSARRPSLYARSTSAFDPFTDRELAAGVSARPLPALPFRLQAELRAREGRDSLELAPAAMAISEVRPLSLPLAVEANAYLAAGYVGGRQATPFVDGMMRLDRAIARRGDAELRLGAGAWGGAQEGAAALDTGPSASLRSSVAGRPLVLSLDYRVRVAGSAEPRSGVAMTLSAGF